MGPNPNRIQKLIILVCIVSTLSQLAICGFMFVYNFTKVFKINVSKKILIQIGITCMIVRLLFDAVVLMDSLDLLRMKSCYKRDLVWPFVMLASETINYFIPIACFARFFSNKLKLYSQN